ncbi:MAG: S-layer homology domain-containing protein, partial [Firmicutes bacterium]|nr:S-layer homology domain-containing protein [Bacillota bacterium]
MKKVLAWAVVLALVLSSFTMAFAGQTKTSKDFKDASQIQYTEAVDVMVATGVINGYPDGTFGPQKTVKRSEMAKMIAVMMNGGEDVGDQFKSACPFKDSQNHWAAGYIAYCASEHIIDGRSADVFDPEAEVTGTEVAKMALTSLGYDSKIQGYTGETWAAAVLKDAKKNNLFDGLDSSF